MTWRDRSESSHITASATSVASVTRAHDQIAAYERPRDAVAWDELPRDETIVAAVVLSFVGVDWLLDFARGSDAVIFPL